MQVFLEWKATRSTAIFFLQ